MAERQVQVEVVGPKPNRISDRLFTFLSDSSAKTMFWWSIAGAACVLLLFATIVVVRPPRIIAPWDVFTLLDGGYMMYSGLTPHTDFYNPIGFLTYYLIALGMHLVGPSLAALTIGNLLFGAVIVTWGWMIARSRLSGFNTFVLMVFLSLLIVTPRPLGYAFGHTSYAMLYNRYGWALLALLVLQQFASRRSGGERVFFADQLSAGLILGLLFFCKVNFFVAGVVAVIVSAPIIRPTVRSTAVLIAGFVTVCVAAEAVAGINPLAYLHDLQIAIRAQSLDDRFGRSIDGIMQMLPLIYLTVLQSLALGVMLGSRITFSAAQFSYARLVLTVLFVLGCSIFITAGNTGEHGEIPLFFISGLIIQEAISDRLRHEHMPMSKAGYLPLFLSAAIVYPVLLGHIFLRDAAGTAYAEYWNMFKATSVAQTQRFDGAALADFVIPASAEWKTAYWRAKDTPARINEGISLLRGHIDKEPRLFVMAQTDPFSMLLGLKPPKGVPLWWDLDLSFNEKVFPDATGLYSNVDLVMIPVFGEHDDGCCHLTVERMLAVYGPYIDVHFTECDRSEHWMLMVRTEPPSGE